MIEYVMLTEADMERVRRVAVARNAAKEGWPNYRVAADKGDLGLHLDGVRAELAVCKRFGFPLDESVSPDGDNGAPDLYVGELRVEVKAATHRPPIIKLNALTDFKADAMVLCFVHPWNSRMASVVELHGVVSRQKFMRDHRLRDFGYGKRVIMEAHELSPIASLDAIAEVSDA